MTIQQLNQYRHLVREIPDVKKRIRGYRKELTGFSTVLASQAEPPYTLHSVTVPAPCQNDIQDMIKMMQRRLRRITRQHNEIEEYIDTISDSQLRRIFQLRFIDGLSWENVTIRIGGGNSEKAVKKKAYRYLKFGDQCHKK